MRHRSGATRDDEEIGRPAPPRSSVEIGQVLRRAREERGLDLLSVHDRIGRPITQLEALELGNTSSVPDQIALVSTLRNYAAFLGLDGDGLALALIDQWSRLSGIGQVPGHPSGPAGVLVTGAVGPEHLRAFTQTGRVAAVSPLMAAAVPVSGIATGPATGVLPAVDRQDASATRGLARSARRRRSAPLALRAVTWLVAVALLAGLGGLAVQRWRPQWLARWHLEHVVAAIRATTTASPPAARPASRPARTARPRAHAAPSSTPVVLLSTGHTAATYSVAAPRYAVTLATSAPCWVQVSSPASATPVAEAVQPAGKTTSYPTTGTLTVQVGASGVVVGIVIDGRTRFTVAPQQAPYTYTFRGT